jgi:Holliday junction resolvase-like predicted endonuclease
MLNNYSAKDIVRLVYEHFSPWGEIEDIIFNQSRYLVYVKYRFRVCAEFAREAMQN